MSAPRPVLVLLLDPDAGAPATGEALRLAAGLVAADRPMRLVRAGAAAAAWDEGALPEDTRRELEVMARFGVQVETLDAPALLALLPEVAGLVRAAPAERSMQPTVLELDAEALTAGAADPAAFLARLAAAGQAVLGRK